MNSIHILTVSVTFLFLTSSFSSAATCDKKDKKALVDFKKHFPRSYTSNWNSHSDCCDWNGVHCDPKSGRVTSLLFMGDTDSDSIPVDHGTVPSSIGDLTALNSITLSDIPNLVGPLPSTMANLKNIQNFAIFNCSISGPLPNIFDQWTSLTNFEINECGKLTGPVPSSLGSLSKLDTITLDYNKFTGTIPSSLFSKLSKDKDVYARLILSHNMLTGPIPQSFARVNWINLDVSYNQLCGKIPIGGNYSSFSGAPFAHNKCLCGTPLLACK